MDVLTTFFNEFNCYFANSLFKSLKMKFYSFVILTVVFSVVFNGCKDSKENPAPPPPLVKKETAAKGKIEAPQKGPIINIIDSVEGKRTILCLKDSAATSLRLSEKLNSIYNIKIPDAISSLKLKKTGQPMAWYKSQKAPFFFEVGIPIEKAPTKLPKGFFIKKTGGDSAFVAHFYGPNELSSVGYDALAEILKERKRKKSAPSYEIYIDNPFEIKKGKIDAYKQQTDIVLPYK